MDQSITMTLALFFGVLCAIIYSLRILVVLERRIARIESHIEGLTVAILEEERKIELEEKKIENEVEDMIKSQKKTSKKKK
jgi:uncharacterized coiled-coil protein SlyX